MRFTQTEIADVWIVDPQFHEDERGRFFRSWCVHEFEEQGIRFEPKQANSGFNYHRGTLRGLHYQVEPALEAKLIRCTRGAVFDVALDARPSSDTYGRWVGVELTPENARMLFVPEHCAHGYQTLQDETEMSYMTSALYTPTAARGFRYDDPAFQITWPLPPVVLSEQDRNWPLVSPTNVLIG